MTINTMKQAEEAILAAKSGDTLVYDGTFDFIPLKGRKPDLTLDFTAGVSTTMTRTGDIDGLTIKGGLFRQGISFNKGRNLTIEGVRCEGTEAREFNGISLTDIAGVYLRKNKFTDCLNGMVLLGISDFEIDDNDLLRIRRDGFNFVSVQRGKVRRNTFRDGRQVGDDHSDGAQLRNLKGRPATEDVLFEGNDFEVVRGQGIATTHKAALGDPRFTRLSYVDNKIKAGAPYGLGMIATDGGLIRGNAVSTLPGSPYPSQIGVSKDSTGIVWAAKNTAEAFGKSPDVSYPPTVPEPAADPRDTKIAELQAALAGVTHGLAAETADKNAALAELAAMRERVLKAVA